MSAKAAKEVQISAVIATLNRIPWLISTVRDCQRQKGVRKEIIVVDQTPRKCWKPKELAWVKRNCRYYFRAKKGVSAARNFGIRKAKGGIVLFLDDDVRFGPRLFQRHYLSHQEPKVGGVFGLILEKNETNKNEAVKKWEKRLVVMRMNNGKSREILWAPSGNTSYKRKALNQTGRFDEKLRVYCEDADLSVRIRFGGNLLLFNPKASLFHLGANQGGLEHRNKNKNPLNKWLRLRDISYYHCKHLKRFGPYSIICQIWETARQYLLNKNLFKLTTKDFLLFIWQWYAGFKLAQKNY
jgi:GT2 family glycosyltransferase